MEKEERRKISIKFLSHILKYIYTPFNAKMKPFFFRVRVVIYQYYRTSNINIILYINSWKNKII
jgi:hypothetical protein